MSLNHGQPFTYLPPEGRARPEELERQARLWVENPVLQEVLEVMEGFVLLINPQHQILTANASFLEAVQVKEPAELRGKRLGEVLACVHVEEGIDGCGTSLVCAQCGMALALSQVRQQPGRTTCEALLSCRQDHRWEAMELRVHASPFPGSGDEEILVVCRDISAEKRREVLESVFFHDVLNSLGGLRGWVYLLNEGIADADQVKSKLDILSAQVVDEVRSHRLVTQAERGALALQPADLVVAEVLRDCASLVQEHPAARGKHIEVGGVPGEWCIHTDVDLLRRVLVNMTLNALEASRPGEVVRLGVDQGPGGYTFSVHNPGVIPEDVRGRIFQRSFSTKAKRGRGLGTYSMKLLGESYLGGKVDFQSEEGAGTTFRLVLAAGMTPE